MNAPRRRKKALRDDGMPVRPAIPLVLPCAASVWAATWYVGQGWPRGVSWACVVVPAVVLVLLSFFLRCSTALHAGPKLSVLLGLVAASWLLGAACTALHFSPQDGAACAALDARAGSYVYVVQSDPRLSSYGGLTFKATAVSREGLGLPRFDAWVSLGARQGGEDVVPRLGEVLELQGNLACLDAESDYEHAKYLQGCALRLRATGAESLGFQAGPVGAIRAFRARMLADLGPLDQDGPSLIAGVVFGDQAAVSSSDVSDTFSKLGLSHMVAVSGSHLALVASLASALVARVRLRPLVRTAVFALLLAVYVCLTGFQVSALRAFIMAVVGLLSAVAGRRAQGLASVGMAALVLLLVSPSCAFSLGFQLSVASVLALVAFSRFAQLWLEALPPRATPGFLSETLSLTLLAQLATLPLTLPVFGTLPMLSCLANVVFVPLVSLVLLLGLLWCVAAVVLPAVSSLLLAAAGSLSAAACVASESLAGLGPVAPVVDVDGFPLWLPCVVAMLLAYALWPRPSVRVARGLAAGAVGTLALALLVATLFPVERMVVLDVGQGDAILLQGGGASVLVDTGPDDAVLYALARQHVWKLDAVIITHTDLDHAGGLAGLAGHVSVDRVIFADGVGERLAQESSGLLDTVRAGLKAELVEVGAGDSLQAGTLSIDVLWPATPVAGDENADSLVMLASWGGRRLGAGDADAADGASSSSARMTALLTGDAESEVVGPLIERMGLCGVDVLKVGHHGSAVSTTPEMVRSLGVRLAVASAGLDNPYGHPRPECIEAVEEGGAQFVCTAQAGDVAIGPDGDAIRLRCARELPLAA